MVKRIVSTAVGYGLSSGHTIVPLSGDIVTFFTFIAFKGRVEVVGLKRVVYAVRDVSGGDTESPVLE